MKNILRSTAQSTLHSMGMHVHPWPSAYHISLDYPVAASPRYGHKVPPPPAIQSMIERERDTYRETLKEIARLGDLLSRIPAEATDDPMQPYWNNNWFPPLDAVALMHFLLRNRPARYLEIGSGNSTMFASAAVTFGQLQTTITSIDPRPRRGIDGLCSEVVRQPLEESDLSVFDKLESGDILFFDGSHRVFCDSDVTVFFLEVLPRIAKGVLVHVHDVFWPHDYPEEWGVRYYSEQYMLGMLLQYAPEQYRVVLPSAYISRDPELAKLTAALTPGKRVFEHYYGTSFWFEAV